MKIPFSDKNFPKYPTHAVRMIDNSTGGHDILFCFAYKNNDVFYCYDTNRRLLEYEGDKILNVWELKT